MVKQAIRIVLLMGVLLGLFGQAAAYSLSPTHQAAGQELAAVDDCMGAMAQPQPKKSEPPCKGLTLDCIAAMGCTAPMLFGDPMVLEPAPMSGNAPLWLDTQILLSGRSFAPDPDPPSLI